MKIDRNNYEAFVLDYLEGNLSPQDGQLLMRFLEDHTELSSALDVDVNLVLRADGVVPKMDKSVLKRHEDGLNALSRKEYLFITQLEEGLTLDEYAELRTLVPDRSDRDSEAAVYSNTVLKANPKHRFKSKSMLKRAVLFVHLSKQQFNRIAAVVAVIFLASLIWLWPDTFNRDASTMVSEAVSQPEERIGEMEEASPKVFEKILSTQNPPSKDSLMKIANDPMRKKPLDDDTPKNNQVRALPPSKALVGKKAMILARHQTINAYEHGLNVMMPIYMSNNVLRRELDDIYKRYIQQNTAPSKNLAVLENGVKVLNLLSKESTQLDKYYDTQGNVVGYHLKGSTLELKRKAK